MATTKPKKIRIGVYVIAQSPALVYDGVGGEGPGGNPQGIGSIRKFAHKCLELEKFGFSVDKHLLPDGDECNEVTLSDFWISVRCFLKGDDLTHTRPLIPRKHPLHKLVVLPYSFPVRIAEAIADGGITTQVRIGKTTYELEWYPSQKSGPWRLDMDTHILKAIQMSCDKEKPIAKKAYELYQHLQKVHSYGARTDCE